MKGNQNDDSDVDIYIEFDKVNEFMELAEQLERIFLMKEDD